MIFLLLRKSITPYLELSILFNSWKSYRFGKLSVSHREIIYTQYTLKKLLRHNSSARGAGYKGLTLNLSGKVYMPK